MPQLNIQDDHQLDEIGSLLIVEDEPLLALQMSRALEDHGWSIFGVAGSIEEANSLLAEPERPDAAVLDVKLAGKDVFPLAQSLRIAGIPFLFCTGYKDLCHIQDFARHRAVRKPATVHQIVQGLKDVVHSAKAELIPARAADQRQVRA